jgi:hypothetical protein
MNKITDVLVVLMLVCCGVAFGATPIVWVVPSTLLRVGLTDAAGSGTTATIYGGQGEYVAFQVAVQAPSGGLTNVTLSATSLTGPGGATIPSSSLILYRESYMTITAAEHSSTDFDTPGLPYTTDNGVQNVPITTASETLPDALIPAIDPATGTAPTAGATYSFKLSSLAASNNVVFWVDALVPRGAATGTYTGTYTVSSTQGSVQGGISLTVWNFTLPLQPSLKSLFGPGDSNLSGGGALAAGIEAALLQNKLMPDSAGTGLANESTDISQYGFNDYDLGYSDGVEYGSCTGSNPPSATTLQSAVNAQPTGLYLNDYSADPESSCTTTAYYNNVIAWAQALHKLTVTGQTGVDNLVSQRPDSAAATGGLFNDGLGTGRSAVDDWTMLPQDYDVAQTDTYDGMPNVTYVLQKGDKVWSYNDEVLDSYSPKWELDFLPINYRIQPGFLSQSLGIKGLLYWAVSNWNSKSAAWTSPKSLGFTNANTTGVFPEEGILVYPGGPAGLQSNSSYQGVAHSMRLKYLRDGVQDYEYIQLLKNCGQTPSQTAMYSLSASGSEYPNWHDWTMNEANLESARLTLGNQIADNCGTGGITLTSIAVTPVSASIAAGGTQAFTATGTYSNGSRQNLTSTATWTSSSTTVATIASTGLATGVAAGTTNITAVSGSITSNTATLTVSPPVTVSVTAPANNATVSGVTTLTATASGGVGGVASVQFVIDLGYGDQENAGPALARAPYTTTFNFATLSAAWYTVSAVATDTAGNTATATIEVDDTD